MNAKRLFLLMMSVALALPFHAATNYGIRIGGVAVTSDNCHNISGDGVSTQADGKVSYDPTTNVLTLKGVYVDCQHQYNGRNQHTGASETAWCTRSATTASTTAPSTPT